MEKKAVNAITTENTKMKGPVRCLVMCPVMCPVDMEEGEAKLAGVLMEVEFNC